MDYERAYKSLMASCRPNANFLATRSLIHYARRLYDFAFTARDLPPPSLAAIRGMKSKITRHASLMQRYEIRYFAIVDTQFRWEMGTALALALVLERRLEKFARESRRARREMQRERKKWRRMPILSFSASLALGRNTVYVGFN